MNKNLRQNLGDIKRELPDQLDSGNAICFFTDCDSKSIGSHSISESRVLSLLEDKTQNGIAVYHLEDIPDVDFKETMSISTFHKTRRQLVLKGKKDTSVFFGFCSNCDSTIFSIIDNNLYSDQLEYKFLHCFRTLAHYLTVERNSYQLFLNRLIPKMYSTDQATHTIEKELLKLRAILKSIPDSAEISWQDASDMSSIVDKVGSIPSKEQRDDINETIQRIFHDMLNPKDYPMSGFLYKQKIERVFDFSKEVKEAYERSSTQELEDIIVDRINEVNIEIKMLTNVFRNQQHNIFTYQHISINQMFLLAGAFVYQLSNGSRVLLTFFPEKETGKTHFLFGEQKLPNSNSMYLSHLNILTEMDFRNAVSDIILTAGANVFFSPRYFNKLPEFAKELLVKDKTELRKMGFNLFSEEFLV